MWYVVGGLQFAVCVCYLFLFLLLMLLMCRFLLFWLVGWCWFAGCCWCASLSSYAQLNSFDVGKVSLALFVCSTKGPAKFKITATSGAVEESLPKPAQRLTETSWDQQEFILRDIVQPRRWNRLSLSNPPGKVFRKFILQSFFQNGDNWSKRKPCICLREESNHPHPVWNMWFANLVPCYCTLLFETLHVSCFFAH